MAEEYESLTKAFSGFGVDEKSIISILGKWDHEQRKSFRKGCPRFFVEDHHHPHFEFQRWEDTHMQILQREFARFKKAIVLWTMHPWERDARLVRDTLIKGVHSYTVLIEIACTRSSEELLGARRAYHSLFDHSIEEDVAYHFNNNINRKLLVALISSYRYEGAKVHEAIAKSEAKILSDAIKYVDLNPIENDEVIRILTTRSKAHLKLVFNHYKELHGKNLDEDLVDLNLKETVLCLSSPQTYFSKVLDMALTDGANEDTKEALTRVTVTRADADMKEIKQEYNKLYGVHLLNKIDELTNGNFKDFLFTLIARSE